MKLYIRTFNLPCYGEVDGKWTTTGGLKPDEWYSADGCFQESDINAIRQCVFCYARGDDLYETPLDEALAHTEVVTSPDQDIIRLGVALQQRLIFQGDEELPERWMVEG